MFWSKWGAIGTAEEAIFKLSKWSKLTYYQLMLPFSVYKVFLFLLSVEILLPQFMLFFNTYRIDMPKTQHGERWRSLRVYPIILLKWVVCVCVCVSHFVNLESVGVASDDCKFCGLSSHQPPHCWMSGWSQVGWGRTFAPNWSNSFKGPFVVNPLLKKINSNYMCIIYIHRWLTGEKATVILSEWSKVRRCVYAFASVWAYLGVHVQVCVYVCVYFSYLVLWAPVCMCICGHVMSS